MMKRKILAWILYHTLMRAQATNLTMVKVLLAVLKMMDKKSKTNFRVVLPHMIVVHLLHSLKMLLLLLILPIVGSSNCDQSSENSFTSAASSISSNAQLPSLFMSL